jgi:hypothetical protein
VDFFGFDSEDGCDSSGRPEFAEHRVYSSDFCSEEYYYFFVLAGRTLDGANSFEVKGYRFVCLGL